MNHTYRLLERIRSPHDVRALPPSEVPQLAEEIRSFLVEKVAATGGHLGPNLGVVELSIALHRVFYSPDDAIIWDTGHQAYVHKILTGRGPDFDSLRREGGLSGYPSREESAHDIVENSHASTAISYADGLAKAWERRGLLGSRHVVAVIGDGALTGGMAWEALNNIAASNRPVVIVVNDNERSYSPTIGGLAHHLATLRTTRNYERFMTWGKGFLQRTPFVGRPLYDALHGVKKGVKDVVAPQGLFEDLGLKYIGPVDGHDEQELEFALGRARDFHQPVIVHAITTKGRGYAPAENDEADRFHGVGVIDPDTGQPLTQSGPTWTSIFADEMLQIGRDETDVVAITAAMLGPTGLERFAASYPDRTYDVGIAEQHAATSAAGLAYGGLHPVVAMEEAWEFVCTHGKRDVCCATSGRGYALARQAAAPDAHVWECSHLGGHRFAPTCLFLPSGRLYGRLDAAGFYPAGSEPSADFLRGASYLSPAAQAADQAVRFALAMPANARTYLRVGPGGASEHSTTVNVETADNGTWHVTCTDNTIEAPASCGAPPTMRSVWQAAIAGAPSEKHPDTP
ncbi:hypothetical protein OA174_05370 [Actinomycetota bacterium]|nr:hypothetical protein [Actinomycetota bacterium]